MAGGPTFALDYEHSIEEARSMFQNLYPDEEFLPRAPEPEEIIMDGYDNDKAEEEKAKEDDGKINSDDANEEMTKNSEQDDPKDE